MKTKWLFVNDRGHAELVWLRLSALPDNEAEIWNNSLPPEKQGDVTWYRPLDQDQVVELGADESYPPVIDPLWGAVVCD